ATVGSGEFFRSQSAVFCEADLPHNSNTNAGDTYGSSPRKLKLWNWTDEQSSVICELNFVSAILAVQINRERLVVCLGHNLTLFHVPARVCLQTLSTPPNPTGLFALSREGASIIAMPSREKGEVVLYDAIALRLLSRVHAHKTNVTAMAFNPASTMIATASE
ncbi:hypothetical protein IQB76_19485, partial [Leptospira borgpetersenii serovar Hardjo-bovis]|uniref:hypothetical protein n=1 Tax=Leptospira borgpetersenii TaxID=174 RepID=UPI00187DDDE4